MILIVFLYSKILNTTVLLVNSLRKFIFIEIVQGLPAFDTASFFEPDTLGNFVVVVRDFDSFSIELWKLV